MISNRGKRIPVGGTVNLPTATAADPAAARREPFVVSHDQLCFDLVDRVHGHADHDQQRSAAKIEIHAQAIGTQFGKLFKERRRVAGKGGSSEFR